MLPTRSRHVQILILLCAAYHLTSAFPTQIPSSSDELQQLKVKILHSGPVLAPLGSSISLPCSASLSSMVASTSFAPIAPRVKWTVVSGGVETQILVARDQRVKVNEAYRDRAALLNYTSSPNDLTLWLGDLRSSDSAHYRCEVQQGLEDASDLVQLKVKGVVFHYRDSLGRYAFSFPQAKRACEAIGAKIATADQLLAAYYDGYEQCDAGWLADQSVRYPIQVPREGCYGNMDGQPGVRNYGTMDPDELFDVYCYVQQVSGEVFHDSNPQRFSFAEAQSYCRAAGAELATTAQLYWAWSEGLDRCSPGWLLDGSVRYPIITPRDRCGGPHAGVKTLYRYSNQTGFPEPTSLHDVYCFRENGNPPTDSPTNHFVTEAEDVGQDVVILVENDQELHLQQAEQVEREAQSALESLPFFTGPFTEEHTVDAHTTASADTTISPVSATSAQESVQSFDETPSSTERSYDSQPVNSTTGTETSSSIQNASSLPEAHNETNSHQNLSFSLLQSELDGTSYDFENQTTEETKQHEIIEMSEPSKEADKGSTQQESSWEVASPTTEAVLQVELSEAAKEDPVQMLLPTEGSQDVLVTQPAQTTKVMIEAQTSLWAPMEGSGDTFRESIVDIEVGGIFSASDSIGPAGNSTTVLTPLASTASAEPRTPQSGPTQSTDTLTVDIHSTDTQLSGSSISRQEGSASLETENTPHMKNEQDPEDHTVSGERFWTTESPENLNTSQHWSTEPITAHHQTSGYRMGLDAVTSTYEEASGHDTDMFGEGVNVFPTAEEGITGSPILDEGTNNSLLLENEVRVTPTFVSGEERHVSSVLKGSSDETLTLVEGKVTPTQPTLQGTHLAPTIVYEEEGNVSSTLEEEEEENAGDVLIELVNVTPATDQDRNVNPTLEDNVNFTQTFDEIVTADPHGKDDLSLTPTVNEDSNVSSTFDNEVSVTQTFDKAINVDPNLEGKITATPNLDEDINVTSTMEDDVNVTPTMEDDVNVTPTMEDDVNVTPTMEDDVDESPTMEDDVYVIPAMEDDVDESPTTEDDVNVTSNMEDDVDESPTTEDDVNVTSNMEDDVDETPTTEDDVNVTPNQDSVDVDQILENESTGTPQLEDESNINPALADFTVSSLDSHTSNWAPLMTTSGPQESQNGLEYSQKTSLSASGSFLNTEPTAASAKTTTASPIRTTTHWSRRSWSPVTTTQKVTRVIPPVDHGLVDFEISLTQPPTLLISPNERAAVGGAGKYSDSCLKDPCLNGGTCSDEGGQVKCLCLPTYGGDLCQIDLEKCEPGWDKFHGYCYRHFGQRQSWEVAEQRCRMLGAHLVSIMTPEEQNFINDNYKEYQWTGLNDKTIEDDFRWSDGNPLLYDNWYRGQPDSYFLSGEDCVVMVWHDGGRWSDVPCNYHLAYTCKKDTTSCGPPPKVRHASIFGKLRQRYETNAVVRYRCVEGFHQRLNPVARCLSGGIWERPLIRCIPEAGGPTQHPDMISPTNNYAAAEEDEFEVTKKTPQYWDIKF